MFPRLAIAAYRLVVFAYPSAFRRQFGAELVETFAHAAASLRRSRGLAPAVAFAARAYVDGLVTAAAERRETRAASSGPVTGRCGADPHGAAGVSGPGTPSPGRGGPSRRAARALGELAQDVRFCIRGMRRSPGFSAVAVASLALGIGATTAIFSIVDGIALRSLPLADADRLVHVWRENLTFDILRQPMRVPPDDVERLRARSRALSDAQAYAPARVHVTGEGEPEEVASAAVTPGFFSLLDLGMESGRGFDAGDVGEPVVVAHRRLLRRRFGEVDAIGRALRIDGVPHVVIGQIGAAHVYPSTTEIWRPLDSRPPASGRPTNVVVIGRLRAGVDAMDAERELEAIAAALEAETPSTNRGWSVWVEPLHRRVVGDAADNLLLLLGAVGFVLLIACANVANLLLVRATSRRREISVRAALGAGRVRLARQLLVESSTLALLGGAAGVLLARGGLDSLLLLAPQELPRLQEITVSGRVLAFAVAVTACAAALFGLAPALRGSRLASPAALRGADGLTARGRRFDLRNAFVVMQVALGMVLLVGAGLLLNSFVRLVNVDPGFDPSGVVRVALQLPEHRYRSGDPANLGLYRDIADRLRRAPGVEAVALGSNIPMSGAQMIAGVELEGRTVTRDEVPLGVFAGSDEAVPAVDVQVVTPRYFSLLSISMIDGRALTGADAQGTEPVGVVNQTMAGLLWPGESPVGRRLRFVSGDDEVEPWITVVGVSADFKQATLDAAVRPHITLPVEQRPEWAAGFPAMNVLVKGASTKALLPALREAVWAVDPELPLPEVETMQAIVAESVAPPRFLMLVLSAFAVAALLLAALGIYGVMAFAVAQRAFEIGVRKALGATSADILAGVLGRALALVGVGLAVGLMTSLWMTRYLQGLLYAVSPTDVATIAAVAALFVAVALLASYLPARRAGGIDPMQTLRRL